MKSMLHVFKSAAGVLGAAVVLAAAGQAAQAQTVLSLKGTTEAVKYEDDNQVRLSVLSFNDEASAADFVEDYQQWDTKSNEAIEDFIDEQETRGYVFTEEATGYTIKYAWKDKERGNRMVFVVTPALKTLNPYMWETKNEGLQPFSVLELHYDGETGVLKTSLDTPVEISDGKLHLQNFDEAETFAVMEDNTPYYLKDSKA